MKKILSLIFFIIFTFSSLTFANAWFSWKTYTSTNLWLQFDYPEEYNWTQIKIKENSNSVSILVWDYEIEKYTVYDLSNSSVEKVLKWRFWDACGDYTLEQMTHAWDKTYKVFPKTSGWLDYGSDECYIYAAFFIKYSPVLNKMIINKWSQDSIIENEEGFSEDEVLHNSIHFIEDGELNSEDKERIEKIFQFIVEEVNSRYSTNDKKIAFYSALEKRILYKKESIKSDEYLLFDYLWNFVSNQKQEVATSDWKTYTHPVYWWKVKYPKDWTYTQFSKTVSFHPLDVVIENKTDNLIMIRTQENPHYFSLREFFYQSGQYNYYAHANNIEDISISGIKAEKLSNFDEYSSLTAVLLSKKWYVIDMSDAWDRYQEKGVFEGIVNSFEF